MRIYLRLRKPWALVCSLILLLAATGTVFGAGVVTNCTEADLRSAMAGGGTVTFACDGTITLSSTVTITNDTVLDATGRAVVISGGSAVRLFQVHSNVSCALMSLTLADGLARGTNGGPATDGGPGEGGAIQSSGNLSALNCAFLRNTAQGGEGGSGTHISPNGNGGPALGGAVLVNGGALNATNCTFEANYSLGGTGSVPSLYFERSIGGDAQGGAIYNQGGVIHLVNCLVSGNQALGGPGIYQTAFPFTGGKAYGGAICSRAGEVWVVHCTVSSNSVTAGSASAAYGGAVHHDGGNLSILESLLESSKATGGAGVERGGPIPAGAAYGGAVSIAAGAIWLTNSTLSGNLALGGAPAFYQDAGSGFGGGAFNAGTLLAINCTICGNTARSLPVVIQNQGSGLGGGLYNNGGSVTLNYTTLSGNSAERIPGGTPGTGSALGGGIHSATGTTILRGTILANSLSGSNSFGTLTDAGHNLSSDASCNFTNTGSLNNTDPVLGSLDDFGGPTPTMPLLGGPAIDAGDPSAAPSVDQRGVPRPYGARPDMGAYEWNGTGPTAEPPAILTNPQPATVFVGSSVVLSVGAQGYQPLSYSWRRDGSIISGANGTSYSFSNAAPSQSGTYTVAVTNVAGAITSAPALVRVKSVQLYHGTQMLTNGIYQFASPPTLTIRSAFANGSAFYTLDGSTPSFASTFYSGPFVLSQSATVRAIGYSADFSQVDEADTVTANVLVNHTLTVSATSGGTVSLNPPGGTYIATNIVTATAQPAAGWYFLYWLGDASGPNPSANVSMERDKVIHAVFGTTLSTTVAGNGSVQVWPPGGVHPLGTTLRLTAIPQPGNYFGFWGNAATGNTNPLYFTITGPNQTVSSIFAPLPADQSALTVLINGHGRVNANPRANAYPTNQSVALTAVPDSGQSFVNWSGDASGTQNPLVVSMAQSRVITANFSSRPWLRVDRPGVEGFTPAGFRLTLVSDPQTAHEIRASSNLSHWTGLGRVTNDFGEVQFTDTNALNAPARFYQAAP